MSIYLNDIPLFEAQSRLRQALENAGLWGILGTEVSNLDENVTGRVTAEPIWAKVSSPHYHASAMDGFAVRAENTIGARPTTPITIGVLAKDSDQLGHEADCAEYVDTGDAMPEWANAVIPVENVESLNADESIASNARECARIRIRSAVTPWSQVRPLGEDIIATQLVMPAGQILRPVDLGAIAAAGYSEIKLTRKPRVAILPTGSELVRLGAQLRPGDILEYNSIILAGQINGMGGVAKRFPITKDDFDLICQRVHEAALEHDLILLNGGSSAGAEDFSARVIEHLGSLLVHGVAVRPGHPVILGILPRGSAIVPIIGVPGYPVSAALTVDIFVEPVIAKWLGRRARELPKETATLTRKVVSPAGDDDYIRVVVGKVGEKLLAAPLARGAGVISSLVQADGLVILPRGTQGVEAGNKVTVNLYRSRAELERTIFCIGSHDLTIDLLAHSLVEYDRRLVSGNVGSQGGLTALRRGEAHLAGSHLLDPETGEYNLSYIKKYIPNFPVKVIALVGREQGLMVKPDNPKRLGSLNDLTHPDVIFINRQQGAGTRILLDYHLNRMEISAQSIQGYNQEEFTHLGVAAAIASGRADCGLGIAAAAHALGLKFIPLFKERYDLIIPQVYAESDLLTPLFKVLSTITFQQAVTALPGYDTSVMGRIIWEA